MKPFCKRILLALLCATALCGGLALAQAAGSGDTLIPFLNQSIAWYRDLQLPAQLSSDPSDSIYAQYNRNTSIEALALIFEFAREQARQLQLQQSQNAPGSASSQPAQRLPELVANAQQKLNQANADLDALQKQAAMATGKKRATLDDQIAEQKSEVDLAQARLETLLNMSAFTRAESSSGLSGKIAELERTVPEVLAADRSAHPRSEPTHGSEEGGKPAGATSGATTSSSTSSANTAPPPTAAPAVTSGATKSSATGILSLGGELFALKRKLNAQEDAINSTAKLHDALNTIREPLRNQLKTVNQRGDELAAQPQSADPAVLASRKTQIDALTNDFKNLSAIVLPLAKAGLLLDAASANLSSWHAETQRGYLLQARELLIRVAFLGMTILLVTAAAEFWRRAIFRYIREQRRRSQFLLIRRIVVTLVIAFILIIALSTEIGSLATFAGFLTAGIAVALQNVILSVAAYFFLIGRYGIRVGDRVQIGDVTGDVVDIGLVRLHLVELDTSSGDARPTGRIVTFSNSVVFQPASNFFKQLPGSNFAWRRITLTLAANVDYGLAQQRLSSAVAKVYQTYKHELDQQHRILEGSLAVHIGTTEPRTRLRLEESGLEIVVLYPVILSRAAQIDDQMIHTLLEAIEAEPRLRLVGGGLASIQPVDADVKTAPESATPQPAK